MNKIMITGRICRDLELKTLDSGTALTRFSVAVDRRFKKEGQPTADFFNCIAWGKTAELICQYMAKGSKIGIAGRLQTGSYDKDGAKVYTTDIVVEEMDFLDSKKDKVESTQSKGDAFEPVDDDELPF